MSGTKELEVDDDFSCSVCLDLMSDPVTLACGHNFCKSCIDTYWSQQTCVLSCPQCKETFEERPLLRSNKMLAEALYKLRKAGLQVTLPCYATPGDVECDLCTGRKCKAIKSCLVCLASYCDAHFQPHEDSVALQKHTVIEASAQLQELICSRHGKLLEVYCQTDQKCVCYLCTMDEHSGHKTVLIGAERAEKQKQAEKRQIIYKQQIQQREEESQELIKSMHSVEHSTETAVESTQQMFRELIQSIEKKCSEETELIRALEKDVMSQAKKQLVQVEQDIADFKRKDDELQQLSEMDNDVLYLQQHFQAFHGLSLCEDLAKIKMNTPYFCKHVDTFVHNLQEQIVKFKHCSDSSPPVPPCFGQPVKPFGQSQSVLSFPSTTLAASNFAIPPAATVVSGTLFRPANTSDSHLFGNSSGLFTVSQPTSSPFGLTQEPAGFSFGFSSATASQPTLLAQKNPPATGFTFGSLLNINHHSSLNPKEESQPTQSLGNNLLINPRNSRQVQLSKNLNSRTAYMAQSISDLSNNGLI